MTYPMTYLKRLGKRKKKCKKEAEEEEEEEEKKNVKEESAKKCEGGCQRKNHIYTYMILFNLEKIIYIRI